MTEPLAAAPQGFWEQVLELTDNLYLFPPLNSFFLGLCLAKRPDTLSLLFRVSQASCHHGKNIQASAILSSELSSG